MRELMDNAIDSGADAVDVYIEEGGISEIRVIDNGKGMTPEDLAVCCRSHATSKIQRVEDLYSLTTLGFRGEALYSISACTRLSICSMRTSVNAEAESGESLPFTLTVNEGIQHGPEPGGSTRGTTVIARDIFYSIPGRRKFLKRPQAESTACRKVFLDKALPFPEISFRFFSSGSLRHHLPASSSLQRVLQSNPETLREAWLGSPEIQGGTYSIRTVCGTPDIYRNDRTGIQIFVNRRRIQEYSLVQAVSYGYSDYLPGGTFPYCTLFIEIDPELVDFNIHPAKREAKIRPLSQIHHETVQLLKGWLHEELSSRGRSGSLRGNSPSEAVLERRRESEPNLFGSFSGRDSNGDHEAAENDEGYSADSRPHRTGIGYGAAGLAESRPSAGKRRGFDRSLLPDDNARRNMLDELLRRHADGYSDDSSTIEGTELAGCQPDNLPSGTSGGEVALPVSSGAAPVVYRGQIFRLFLLAEIGDRLLLVDQHAAHERIIYEELRSRPITQKLLIPFRFEPEPDAAGFLSQYADVYRSAGIELEPTDQDAWELRSLPASCRSIQGDIIDFITSSAGNAAEIEKQLYAMIACRAAVKDGDVLDQLTAEQIIHKALALPIPRCPHGRPIWIEISRDQLFRGVGRII